MHLVRAGYMSVYMCTVMKGNNVMISGDHTISTGNFRHYYQCEFCIEETAVLFIMRNEFFPMEYTEFMPRR